MTFSSSHLTGAKASDLTTRARVLIREQVHEGAPVKTVALRLRMSPRTLQRRLADEGVPFQRLVDAVREAVARAHLSHGRGGSERLSKERPSGENALMAPTAWKPQLAPIDLKTLPLSADEGYLVSRIDGQTTLEELALLTGLPRTRVTEIVDRLVETGALFAPAPSPAAVEPLEVEAPTLDDDGERAAEEESAAVTGSHLKLYRDVFHELAADERARLASVERGVRLSALCFDPLPAVVHSILQNPNSGPEQARLIAAHHRNSAGLEWLVLRADLMRDAQVQRLLWRNPQLNEGQLRRLTASKRLLELWKLTVSREATTQTRTGTAKVLRMRFSSAAAEEKIELIFTTEGRALSGLSGIPIDGKTSALLCGRNYSSQMLVQNIAHWSAAPPALIAHLLKQPLVVRQPQLRTALSRHPNAPASVKRA